jgi:hypothetical protein
VKPSSRNFDPRSVGSLECRAWEMYYRRRWLAVLVAFVALIRSAFGEPRAEAMDVSDRWIAAGCDHSDPLLGAERVLLVRSFAALLAAVHR